jgi:hypothetical protein
MDWLKAIAPTIATVLGGPLAGMAVEAIGAAFGMTDATQERVKDIMQSGQMTGEQIAALKIAEQQLVVKLKELDLDVDRIHATDRDSARKMQMAVGSRIPGVLAILITCGFFGILIGMMVGAFKVSDNQAMLIMLGALGAAWGAVVNYYYGSSRGSEQKSAMLANSVPAK